MELVALPPRDKAKGMSITQQRKAAHAHVSQITSSSSATSSRSTLGMGGISSGPKSWVLKSLLEDKYKRICNKAVLDRETQYNALIMIILSTVSLSDDRCISEDKLEHKMERLGLDRKTPVGELGEVLGRMVKQGYLERFKSEIGAADGESQGFVLHLGPRGKLETLQNVDNMLAFLERVYGVWDKERTEPSPLEKIVRDTLEEDEAEEEGEEEG